MKNYNNEFEGNKWRLKTMWAAVVDVYNRDRTIFTIYGVIILAWVTAFTFAMTLGD